MTVSALRALLRIAWRELRSARARSLLIVLVLALPVARSTLIEVGYRTQQLDRNERIDRVLGRADALYLDAQSGGQPIFQDPDALLAMPAAAVPNRPLANPELPALPPDATVLSLHSRALSIRAGRSEFRTVVREFDYGHPLASGILVQVAGRAPAAADEVAASTEFLRATGTGVGDRVDLGSAGQLTVVGAVRDPSRRDAITLVARPGALLDRLGPELDLGPAVAPSRSWLVGTGTAVTWDQVKAANTAGLQVYSRHVATAPPSEVDVPLYRAHQGVRELTGAREDPDEIGLHRVLMGGGSAELAGWAAGSIELPWLGRGITELGVLSAATLLLESVLLACAAFAVGARRQRRQVALLGATGADRSQLRTLLLVQGGLLGLAGAVVGVLGGIGLAVALSPVVQDLVPTDLGRLDLRLPELLAVGSIAVAGGLIAAWLPASAAGRDRSRRPATAEDSTHRRNRRYAVAGAALTVAGVTIAGYAALASSSRLLALSATMLAAIGLIACCPALVVYAGRLGGRLPVVGRIALRDAGQHRTRSAPAVAAIMIATASAIGISTVDASGLGDRPDSDRSALPELHAALVFDPPAPGAAAEPAPLRNLVNGLTAVLQVSSSRAVVALRSPASPCHGPYCDGTTLRGAGAARGSLGAILVGDTALLRELTGGPDSRAEGLLADGGIVVFDEHAAPNGRAALTLRTDSQSRDVELAAVHRPSVANAALAVISARTARQLGAPSYLAAVELKLARPPNTGEQERAASAAAALIPSARAFRLEHGSHDRFDTIALVVLIGSSAFTLAAIAATTALAVTDTQRDSAVLAAVGAPVRTRRLLAASQATVVAGLGSGLGTLLGLLPAGVVAVQHARALDTGHPTFALPWAAIAIVLIVVPAIAALAAMVFTGNRVPLSRRLT